MKFVMEDVIDFKLSNDVCVDRIVILDLFVGKLSFGAVVK